MPTLSPKPYTVTKDQFYKGETIISIDASQFAGTAKKEGQLEISFQHCHFDKVKVICPDNIDFGEIGMHFYGCTVKAFEIGELASRDISINFGSCLLSARLESSELQSVSLNNCIADSVYLLKIPRVNISYSEENIFPHEWHKLLGIAGIDCKAAIAFSQRYHIEGVEKIYFEKRESEEKDKGLFVVPYRSIDHPNRMGYRLSDAEKLTLDISLYIKIANDNPTGEVKITNVRLSALTLTGEGDGKIRIENARIDNIYLYDFSPTKEAGFFNIRPASEGNDRRIGIHKCNLDNVWFDNFDFIRYNHLSFYKSKFAKTTYTSCSFPDSYKAFGKFQGIENVHYPDRKEENSDKDLYELLLQLKKALEGTGNYYEAQKIHSISHEALKRVKQLPRQERIILGINNLSNTHGLSIGRPFLGLIFFSVFFYALYLLSLGRIFNATAVDWKLFGYYFSFLDLTHRTDFLVDKDEFTGASLAIDYVAKIFTGFFIYQFIASFRKYGKK